MSIRQIYLRSGLFSLAGKLVTSFAALGIIWLITRIGGKDVFGEIMIAYAFNFVIAASLAALFQAILLYHVSRGTSQHRDKLGASLFFAVMIGFALVLAEKAGAEPLAALMGKPGLAMWFSSLAWMIPAFAVNSILSSWYRAKQDVSTMVMHFEVWPNIFRLVFLCAVLFTLRDPQWIATAYVFSYVSSFLLLYVRDPVPLNANPRLFTWWGFALQRPDDARSHDIEIAR